MIPESETVISSIGLEEGVPVLERIQRIAASDFVRKVAETYATQVFLLAVSLVTSITVTRILGPQGRGLYAVAMATGLIGVQFGNLGLHASNTYYLAQDQSLLSRLLGNSLVVSFGLGGGIALLASIVFALWPGLAPLQGTILWLGLTWIPVGLAFLLMENLLLGLQDVRSYNKVELLNRMVGLALIGFVILTRRVTAEMVFVAVLLAMLVSCLWAGFRLWPRLSSFPTPSLRTLVAHFRLGIKPYLIALFGYLLLRTNLMMVKYLLGVEQAGYYSVASVMADYILMLPSVIGLILFPRLSALNTHAEKHSRAIKAAAGTAAALLPILIVAGVAAGPVVRILFGKAFMPSARAFLWLIPGILAMGIETSLVQFLNSIGYPPIVVWVWFFAAILNMALNFWAIPTFGIVGASAVSSLSYSLVFVAIVVIVRQKYRQMQAYA
jgi:O-antigen/teichoic acid export membrane protein